MNKRVVFHNKLLPYLLLAPQLAVTLIFFIWPAGQAIRQSVIQEDAFGLSTRFVWFKNFQRIFADPNYLGSLEVTIVFSLSVAVLALGVSLLLAVMADRVIHGASAYKTLLIWPYAVAPAAAGALWMFLFDPTIGVISRVLQAGGVNWNYFLNGTHAMILVVIAATWTQISYNFVFFLAGLQSIPRSVIEAAAIDGAGPGRRFWTIVFPLLSPTGFFLLTINIVYAFFSTFGVIDIITRGGPAGATNILVYKVYSDSFRALDLGGSAAQSVVLMVIVIGLTVAQFRYIERKVHY
ncbi:MAG TPA: sn-glycerol-3-phosphate ABC transporter permease UgpA [Alphaproteobacteria bacterium]|nr:sn-glycerol-3-phosphate ABC transporter permease UgpA [Alphaproteobacteria bacterium]